MKGAGLETYYIPGEHDTIGDDGKLFFERFGRAKGTGGWYSFDQGGVHFVALVNVVGLKAGGMGTLGAEQREWLERRSQGQEREHADRRPRAHAAVVGLSRMGLGHRRRRAGAGILKRFGSVTVLERPHPPGDPEGRGSRHPAHRLFDRFRTAGARPRARTRPAQSAGREAANRMLGVRRVELDPRQASRARTTRRSKGEGAVR